MLRFKSISEQTAIVFGDRGDHSHEFEGGDTRHSRPRAFLVMMLNSRSNHRPPAAMSRIATQTKHERRSYSGHNLKGGECRHRFVFALSLSLSLIFGCTSSRLAHRKPCFKTTSPAGWWQLDCLFWFFLDSALGPTKWWFLGRDVVLGFFGTFQAGGGDFSCAAPCSLIRRAAEIRAAEITKS